MTRMREATELPWGLDLRNVAEATGARQERPDRAGSARARFVEAALLRERLLLGLVRQDGGREVPPFVRPDLHVDLRGPPAESDGKVCGVGEPAHELDAV